MKKPKKNPDPFPQTESRRPGILVFPSLPSPSSGSRPLPEDLYRAFHAALAPFGEFSDCLVDSFNVHSSDLSLERTVRSQKFPLVLTVRAAQRFGNLLSQCTRLGGTPLLSPSEAFERLIWRFFTQVHDGILGFPQAVWADWSLEASGPDSWPAGSPAFVCRILAGVSLVEIRLWAPLPPESSRP